MMSFSRYIAPIAMAASILGTPDAFADDRAHPRDHGHHWMDRFMAVYDVDHDGKVKLDEIFADQERLFGAVDTDGDKQLTPEEFRRRGHMFELFVTTSLFDLLDANGDGKLTVDELLAPSRRWFARYDANANGAIEAAELPEPAEGFMRGRMPRPEERADRPPPRRFEHFARAFDTSGDGKVTLSEIEDTLRRLFGTLDSNGDRSISADEFRSGPRAREIFAASSIFDLLDSSGDGKVSLNEIHEPSKHWFLRYDANSDGAMTEDELAERHARPRDARKR